MPSQSSLSRLVRQLNKIYCALNGVRARNENKTEKGHKEYVCKLCMCCVCVLYVYMCAVGFFPCLPTSRLYCRRERTPSDDRAAPVPSHATSHLGVVHVPEQAVGLRVQNKVPPQKLAAVLILLDVQKPTDSVLPIHIRHSWALLTSPCVAGGQKGEAVRKRAKRVPGSG